jgi:hypothetical protein
MKKGGNGLHRVTRFELLGEMMVGQSGSRLLLVILEGEVEEQLERRGWRGMIHIPVVEG